MSDDRLEQALDAMRQESADEAALEAARARVWSELTGDTSSRCAAFRQDFPAYLNGTLVESRRVLTDDHLSRCPACRSAMAELKGERRVIPMPQRVPSRWKSWAMAAAAAVVLLGVAYGARDTIDAMLAPAGPRATVVSADGALYRVAGESLKAGATLAEGEIVRTGPGAHAVLRLTDGSMVDVNERTELFATAAWSGQAIHLARGDVIVRAAKQRRGYLRVVTRDSIASVKGTVFAVSTGLGGSVVSVVEGSVAVDQPGRNVLLKPGQQAASNPALTSSVEAAIAWSPSADEYLEILSSFVKIERQLAENFPTEQRTSSSLLAYLPTGALAYGAMPNIGGRIGVALSLAEQQSSDNAAFRAWWNSETGQSLRQMIDRLQSVSAMLGDEVVFCASSTAPGQVVPMVIARVRPDKRAELAGALDALFAGSGEPPLSYSIHEDLMVVSDSPTELAWNLANLGRGATSPFSTAIADRYRRGTGWLMALDAPAFAAMATEGDGPPPLELAAMLGMKYVFLEQRAPAGTEENEVTLVFDGARKGMASWLAEAGSGGVSEYLPADALVAGFVSMREPSQLFQEFTAVMAERNATFDGNLAKVNDMVGTDFFANLTTSLGNEAAFALNGFSLSGPRWTMVALAYNPTVIDGALRKFIDAFNAELSPEQQANRVVFEQETVGGRTWNTMRAGELPLSVTWTYDAGYMVAASDRATAERAIATRNGGSQLVWSADFLKQLPASAGMHPSGFAWVNTKGALEAFSTFTNPTISKLLAERDPVLMVFDGSPEQIHAASRTRVTGLILNMMLLESLSRTSEGQPSSATP